jgi:hypothetical protein
MKTNNNKKLLSVHTYEEKKNVRMLITTHSELQTLFLHSLFVTQFRTSSGSVSWSPHMDKPFVVCHLFCNTYPLPSHSCFPVVPTTENGCTNQTRGEKQPPASTKEISDHSLTCFPQTIAAPAYALITLDWWETKKMVLGFRGLHLWFINAQQTHHRHMFFWKGITK